MDWNPIRVQWRCLKDEVHTIWGDLSETHLTQIDGCRDRLIAAIQEVYGLDEKAATREVDAWHRAILTREDSG